MEQSSGPQSDPITIKKYANRRLYNTATSSYVTLDHLCRMVKEGTDFQVFDAKTGEDITRSVLTQIIVEEEAKGENLLPISFLRQLIRFYDDSLRAFVPRYLEISMENFARNQEQMRGTMENAFGGLFPFNRFDEMGRQNMALIQRAFSMFTPPAGAGATDRSDNGGDGAQAANAADAQTLGDDDIDDLKTKLDAMQRQLDELARKSGSTD